MPRFAGLNRPRAVAVLLALVLSVVLCVLGLGPKYQGPASPTGRGKDLELYAAIVDRVRTGESYYKAAGVELRARGYGTRSVFNWRVPVYAWLLGKLPGPAWGQGLLATLALLAMATTFAAMDREAGLPLATSGTILLFLGLHGCFLGSSHGVYLSTELWSGTLIVLSITLRALGCRRLGVASGLLALCVRELAFPYVLIALISSRRRRGEFLAWSVGLLVYGLAFAWHARTVLGLLTGFDRADADGWVQWGGLRFVLETVSVHSLLLQLPTWAPAVYLPLSLLGLAGWRGEMGRTIGLTVATYLALFAVVGKPFNGYWGLMDSGLLGLGLAWAPVALRDLFLAALARRSPAASS